MSIDQRRKGDELAGRAAPTRERHGRVARAMSAIIAVGLLGVAPSAWAQLGDMPGALVADFNGDGKLDVAATNFFGGGVFIYLGDGQGGFGPPSQLFSPYVGVGAPLAEGDFNGDGKIDLVVTTQAAPESTVTVLLGDGTGGFSASCQVSMPADPFPKTVVGLIVADFNGDGRQDLAVATTGGMFLLLGDGAGCLAPPTLITNGLFQAATAADLNGDGTEDLIGATAEGLVVLLGDGQGGFGAPSIIDADLDAVAVVAADFRRDGKQDLAVLATDTSGMGTVYILMGDGRGGFAPHVSYPLQLPAPYVSSAVIAGDFNGDGQLDLAVWSTSSDTPQMVFLVGDGAGHFSTAVEGFDDLFGWAVVGNFNGDGRDTLAVEQFFNWTTVSTLQSPQAGHFSTPESYSVTPAPSVVVTGDFNKDGSPDIAALTPDGTLSVLLGNGAGGVGTPIGGLAPAGATAVAVADFNSDGTPDLAVLNPSGVSILIGDGSGGFVATGSQAVGGSALVAADLNGDGKQDLIIASGGGIAVLLGDGAGGFGAPTSYAVGSVTSLAAGDLNGDGHLDVVAGTTSGLVVLLGDGAGGFGPPASFASGFNISAVGLADFNGDGKLDIVSGSEDLLGTLSILLGDGAGGFATPLGQDTNVRPGLISLGDFNGDGKTDVAIVGPVIGGGSLATVQILFGDGQGNLSHGPLLLPLDAPGATSASMATADFNGDGRTDLVGTTAGGLSILLAAGQADLSVTIDDGQTVVVPGQTLSYVITVTNGGPAPVSGVTVADFLPAKLTGASWTCVASPGSNCAPSGTGDLVDSLALLNGGIATYTLTASVAPDALGSLSNSAHIALPVGLMNPIPAYNTATHTDLIPSSVAIDDVTVGDAGAPAVFTVALAPPSPVAVTVQYATADGTAVAGADYTASSGVLTFPPGTTTQTLSVPVAPQSTIEETKSFFVRMSTPSGGLISKATGQAWILNTEQGERIEFSSASYLVNETAQIATITVRRTGSATGTVTADYSTSDGSAIEGVQYREATGIVAFEPGQVSRTFTIPVIYDPDQEGNRTVLLTLSDARGGAVLGATSTAVLTIANANVAGSVQFSSPTYSVWEYGRQRLITVTRRGGAAAGVTVDYATSSGTASLGREYLQTSGTLSFGAGVMSRTFSVPVLDDGAVEGDSTVNLNLSNVGGGASFGAPSSAVLTILQDNPVVEFKSDHFSASEASGQATIVVRLLRGRSLPIHVGYSTSPGSATPGVDYLDTSGTLTFLPGQTTGSFTVTLLKNVAAGNDATVLLKLLPPDVGSLSQPSTAVLTIAEVGEGAFCFAQGVVDVPEKAPAALLTVLRIGPAAQVVTVDYATQDGGATAGTNYVRTSGTLTFGVGVSRQNIRVPLLDDGKPHGIGLDFWVTLSNAQGGASVFPATPALVSILSDDPQLKFDQSNYTVSEGGKHAIIRVDRKGPLAPTVMVDYSTQDLTAIAGTDYTAVNGTLTFGPGVARTSFSVPITDHALVGADATLMVDLSNPQGAVLDSPYSAAATLTITTDEAQLEFSAGDFVAMEGATEATITVNRLGPAGGNVSVRYLTFGSVEVTGTLTFASGVTSRTFKVPLSGNPVLHPIQLVLSNPSGAVLGALDAAVLTIGKRAPAGLVQFSLKDYSAAEDGPFAVLTVTRTGDTTEAATVDYATSDGTAIADINYLPAAGTLVFAKGETRKTFAVTVLDPGVQSGNLTVNLTLSQPIGTKLGKNSGAKLWIVPSS